jgi:hypothetical protein
MGSFQLGISFLIANCSKVVPVSLANVKQAYEMRNGVIMMIMEMIMYMARIENTIRILTNISIKVIRCIYG